MKAESYPPPANTLAHELDWIVNPSPLPSVDRLPPANDNNTPSLPSFRRASDSFLPGWLISTHVVPAAYPRLYTAKVHESHYDPPFNHLEKTRKDISQRARRTAQIMFEKKRKLEDGESHGLILGEKDNEAVVMYNVLNRYCRQRKPAVAGSASCSATRLTIFAVHGNGFHKETWEPTFKFMVEHLESSSSSTIVDEVWSFETINHGDSAIINRPYLGDLVDVNDFPRDVNSFMINYLPESQPGVDLPYILPRLPMEVCDRRTQGGFVGRNVVGLGHSLGALCIARAAEEFPSLWSSLILVDPIIYPPSPKELTDAFSTTLKSLMSSAIKRRSTWKNRGDALACLKSAPYFGAWNDLVLKSFVDYGLREDGENVSLKTTGFQEAATFCNRHPPAEAWYLLNTIPMKIPIRWVMAEETSVMTGADRVGHIVWRRPQNSSNIRLPGAHHPIPQETPDLLGQEIAHFLTKEYSTSTSYPRPKL